MITKQAQPYRVSKKLTLEIFCAIQATQVGLDYPSGLELHRHIIAIHYVATVDEMCHTEYVVPMDPKPIPHYCWCFIGSQWVSGNHPESVITMWYTTPVKHTRWTCANTSCMKYNTTLVSVVQSVLKKSKCVRWHCTLSTAPGLLLLNSAWTVSTSSDGVLLTKNTSSSAEFSQ